MASDLPPAYNTLQASTENLATMEGATPHCEDGAGLLINNNFEDKTVRVGFIQKVLAIKSLQMIGVAIGMFILASTIYSVIWQIRRNPQNFITIPTLAFIGLTGLVFYCDQIRRQNPYRYLFLVYHPISLWGFISILAIYLDFFESLAVAYITYCGAVFAVLLYSIFALQTKLEFATKHCILVAVCVQIFCFVISIPFNHDSFAVFYAALAMSVSYIYIFLDLETMVSKTYWHTITPADYVDAALNLHIDYYYYIRNVIWPKITYISSQ